MKITKLKTFYCDAGWRPWIFLKLETDKGIVGWSECSESFGSPRAIESIFKDFESLVVGADPMAQEALYWNLYRISRQSPGGVIQKAIAAIENACLDIKGKALGVPVYQLFGGAIRDSVRLYWSHCGTTRVRSAEHVGKTPIKTFDDIYKMGREVVEQGYTALKTNLLLPTDPVSVLQQGFRGPSAGADQNLDLKTLFGIEKLMGTFREAVGPEVDICLDLNFNFKTEGAIRIAKVLEPFKPMWLEMDFYNAEALREIRRSTHIPICSGEDLYTTKGYRPFFEQQAMSTASVDIIWNGFHQSKKIADMAESYEMNVAPHNHYSHLATFISAQFCAAVPNVKILEVDVDDVPWREELTTQVPEIKNGYMMMPTRPGWGVDINEDVLKRHPWPK